MTGQPVTRTDDLTPSDTSKATGMGDVERDINGETVCGFLVAAYRETHPEHGDKYGHTYSEHWSTPGSCDPRVKVERLFTEEQLRQALTGGREVERLRPEVAAFAVLMEEKLRANDHKPGWKGDSIEALVKRVNEEAGELERAVIELNRQVIWADEPTYGSRGGNGWSRRNPATGKRQVGVGYQEMSGTARDAQLSAVAREAADVANMAMMVADLCGALASGDSPNG